MSNRGGPGDRFAAELRKAGLEVRRKNPKGHKDGWVVYGPGGRMLGAFGSNVEKGRTKKNILAQIKRAGIRL